MLAVRAMTGNIFIVCIDTKFADSDNASKGFPAGGQAGHMRNVVQGTRNSFTDSDSLAGAFAQGHYIFLYLSSHNGPRVRTLSLPQFCAAMTRSASLVRFGISTAQSERGQTESITNGL